VRVARGGLDLLPVRLAAVSVQRSARVP
jgi:hypothetical protein